MIVLFRFRNNTDTTKKYVKIFNLRFDLDGRSVADPIYNLMNQRESAR